jgi:hypothetical protein
VSDGRPVIAPTGLLSLDSASYHADLIDDNRPSLSKSIIAELIERSPAHARVKHPRLNPDFVRVEEDKFSLGTAAHQLFLEGTDAVAVIPYDDWRTKAAKEARDEAREYGRIPMLAAQYDECCALVESLRAQCDSHPEGPFFTDGTAEQTLVWEDEYGVLCRARLDWLRDDLTAIDDLKSTKASANPEQWTRTMYGFGAPLQVAFYLRGARAVLNCEPAFRFVVIETTPPFAMSVVALAPDALALADKQVSWALKKWATCLRNDDWPAYDQRIAYAEAPPWEEARWLSKELREVEAA